MPLHNGFALYFGGGIFLSSYDYGPYRYKIDGVWYVERRGIPYFGIEGVLGADYYIPNTPVVLGLDLRPRFFNVVYPYLWDAGLNVRYEF